MIVCCDSVVVFIIIYIGRNLGYNMVCIHNAVSSDMRWVQTLSLYTTRAYHWDKDVLLLNVPAVTPVPIPNKPNVVNSPGDTRKAEKVTKVIQPVVPVHASTTHRDSSEFEFISPVVYTCRVIVTSILNKYCFAQGEKYLIVLVFVYMYFII